MELNFFESIKNMYNEAETTKKETIQDKIDDAVKLWLVVDKDPIQSG